MRIVCCNGPCSGRQSGQRLQLAALVQLKIRVIMSASYASQIFYMCKIRLFVETINKTSVKKRTIIGFQISILKELQAERLLILARLHISV